MKPGTAQNVRHKESVWTKFSRLDLVKVTARLYALLRQRHMFQLCGVKTHLLQLVTPMFFVIFSVQLYGIVHIHVPIG